MINKKKNLKEITSNTLTSTYGSRFMVEPIPKYQFPKNKISKDVAYQVIHDEITLDGKPAQNLATFVTTWMEHEAVMLIKEGLHFNLADEDEYPHVIKIQEYCVNMLARLFNSPEQDEAVGTSTIGSSEAMMLAGLAMKWRWRKRRQQQGLSCDKPNLVMGSNVQVCWDKFARYFDVEPKFINIEEGRFTITPEQVLEAIDENTIGVCAILGTTFTGEFEPIKAINDALQKANKKNGWEIPIHVDAASGGFVAPFLYPKLKWDFRLPLVQSINVSGHKYGLVYPGVGWVIWRDKSALPDELVFHVNYLGGDMPTFNLNFSRPASHVVAQFYNFIRLGFEGYKEIITNLQIVANYLRDELSKIDIFTLHGDRKSLPVVTFSVNSDCSFDSFHLSHKLRRFGWIVPAYTMPANAEHISVLRVVVQEKLSRDMADNLIADIKRSIALLNEEGDHHETIVKGSGKQKIC